MSLNKNTWLKVASMASPGEISYYTAAQPLKISTKKRHTHVEGLDTMTVDSDFDVSDPPYVVDGVASTGKIDGDGEIVIQSGIDTSMFARYGKLNWNHTCLPGTSDPSGFIGTVSKVYRHNGQLCVRGVLFPGHHMVNKIIRMWDNMKRTDKDPFLGYSIEMSRMERDPMNPKIIRKCVMVGLAITLIPSNLYTIAKIVKPTKQELAFHISEAKGLVAMNAPSVFRPYGETVFKNITKQNIKDMSEFQQRAEKEFQSILNQGDGQSSNEKSLYNESVEGTSNAGGTPVPMSSENSIPTGKGSIPGGTSSTNPPSGEQGSNVPGNDGVLGAKGMKDPKQEKEGKGKKEDKKEDGKEKEDEKGKKGAETEGVLAKLAELIDRSVQKHLGKSTEGSESPSESKGEGQGQSQMEDYVNSASTNSAVPGSENLASETLKSQQKSEILNEMKSNANMGGNTFEWVMNDSNDSVTAGTVFDPALAQKGIAPDLNFNEKSGKHAADFRKVINSALQLPNDNKVKTLTVDFLKKTGDEALSSIMFPVDDDVGVDMSCGEKILQYLRQLTKVKWVMSPDCLHEEIEHRKRTAVHPNATYSSGMFGNYAPPQNA